MENDEKDVKKYKTPRSGSSLSGSRTISEKSKTIKKSETKSKRTIGGPLWQKEKRFFANLLDSFDMTELVELTFRVFSDDNGLRRISVEKMEAKM